MSMISIDSVMDAGVFDARKDFIDLFVVSSLFVIEVVKAAILKFTHDCG